ncbi:MAG: hypothetical protein ACTS8Z_02580 [Candidatus Limnocylindrales bacterium]
MTDRTDLPTSPQHASHDRVLISSLASREADLTHDERSTARTLIADCAECRDLLADIASLAAAVPTAAIPARSRDFRLTAADAARLRPGGWRRLIGFIGSARDGFTRPLALGLTTMGLTGLLVATLPSVMGGAASSAVLSTVGNAVGGQAAPAPAPSFAPYQTEGLELDPGAAASAEGDGGLFSGAGDTATGIDRASDNERLAAEGAIRDDRTGLSVLGVVAGALLILGFGLFALRWTARRLGDS